MQNLDIKQKTYNSVNMVVFTQPIAFLILAASRLTVKRFMPPEHPGIWLPPSQNITQLLERLDEQISYLSSIFTCSARKSYSVNIEVFVTKFQRWVEV